MSWERTSPDLEDVPRLSLGLSDPVLYEAAADGSTVDLGSLDAENEPRKEKEG